MAFVIMATFIDRIEKQGMIDLKSELYKEMIQYNLVKDTYQPDILGLTALERPPIIDNPDYRRKFNIDP